MYLSISKKYIQVKNKWWELCNELKKNYFNHIYNVQRDKK